MHIGNDRHREIYDSKEKGILDLALVCRYLNEYEEKLKKREKKENPLLTNKELEQISSLIYIGKHYIQRTERYYYNDIRNKIDKYLEERP
jgi:hypothetical protein